MITFGKWDWQEVNETYFAFYSSVLFVYLVMSMLYLFLKLFIIAMKKKRNSVFPILQSNVLINNIKRFTFSWKMNVVWGLVTAVDNTVLHYSNLLRVEHECSPQR